MDKMLLSRAVIFAVIFQSKCRGWKCNKRAGNVEVKLCEKAKFFFFSSELKSLFFFAVLLCFTLPLVSIMFLLNDVNLWENALSVIAPPICAIVCYGISIRCSSKNYSYQGKDNFKFFLCVCLDELFDFKHAWIAIARSHMWHLTNYNADYCQKYAIFKVEIKQILAG